MAMENFAARRIVTLFFLQDFNVYYVNNATYLYKWLILDSYSKYMDEFIVEHIDTIQNVTFSAAGAACEERNVIAFIYIFYTYHVFYAYC